MVTQLLFHCQILLILSVVMPDGGKEEQELKATNGNGKPRSEIGGEKNHSKVQS